MFDAASLILYHSPNTRSSATRVLLEELGAPYTLHGLDMKKGQQREAAYLAVNPMGKVPAIVHNGSLITETVAIFIYLADHFSKARLAPAIGERNRGPYLRWMTYYAACFEPAVVDRAQKREQAPTGMSPYGDFDTMLKTLTDQLDTGPYLLDDGFSAADILWGAGLGWTTSFGLVPKTPVIEAYVERMQSRMAALRVKDLDAELEAKFASVS
jgi:glutathione S-transferase